MRAFPLSYDRPVVAAVPGQRRTWRVVLTVYPLLLLTLCFLAAVAPQRTGLQAVAQIFAPLLFLPLLLLAPFALLRGAVVLRVVLLVSLGVFMFRYMPPLNLGVQVGSGAGATQISVMTWNVFAGNSHYDEVNLLLAAKPADVVLLQEADASQIDEDTLASVYPYRFMQPDDAPPGMVFLSDRPIVAHGLLDGDRALWDIPRLMWARLDLGDGREVTVVGAHPMSAYSVGADCRLPVCYSPAWRDEQIKAMRDDFISPMLDSGDKVIVAGDFNITERESAYSVLAQGMTDSWKAVGSGFGTTWRPTFMMGQQLGLLRIDYLFAGPSVKPLRMSVDCSPRGSDHCPVTGRFEIEH